MELTLHEEEETLLVLAENLHRLGRHLGDGGLSGAVPGQLVGHVTLREQSCSNTPTPTTTTGIRN